MRGILFIVVLLISGCQRLEKEADYLEAPIKNISNKGSDHLIYERYKYSKDRYTIQQDAAPIHPPHFSFKELIPIKEPLSRYGNPSEYKVAGRKYQVLQSAQGYKARGIASWYGSKFHKQRTSSGEPYDMYVMSAAHRTLPLPTYVKVRNLENGKTAIVKINDRGPFHGDRIVDLSYAAALKLGVFPKGTAHVEIETLKGPSKKAQYYLQTGAFTSEVLAKHSKDKLRRFISQPIIVERYQQHYVVRIGPFSDRNLIEKLKINLAQQGVKGAFSILA